MKNEMMVLNEQEVLGKQFKVYGDNENPLFLAKDVADWIDYSDGNSSHMCGLVDSDEVVKKFCSINATTNGTKPIKSMGEANRLFLTEDGLYEVLMLSRKPIAREFKKEVKKILKTIRKTGGYVANTAQFVDVYFSSMDEEGKAFIRSTLEAKLKIEQELKLAKEETKQKVKVIDDLTMHLDSVLLRKTATDYVTKIVKDKGLDFSDIYNTIYNLVGRYLKKDIKKSLEDYKEKQRRLVDKNKKENKISKLKGEDRLTPFRLKDSKANITTIEYLVDVLGEGAVVLEVMAKVFEVGIDDVMEKYSELSNN